MELCVCGWDLGQDQRVKKKPTDTIVVEPAYLTVRNIDSGQTTGNITILQAVQVYEAVPHKCYATETVFKKRRRCRRITERSER